MIITRFFNWLFAVDYHAYHSRFVARHWQRGLDAGISEDELKRIWKVAIAQANYDVIGGTPAAVFSNYVDREIEYREAHKLTI